MRLGRTPPRLDALDRERRLGDLWAESLADTGLRQDGWVTELGPGFSAKVGHGLHAVGFRGRLVVVEPHPAARRFAVRAARRALPDATVRARSRPQAGGRAVDAVVANHLLDDLVLAAATPPALAARLFGAMRQGTVCSAEYVRAWTGILDAGRSDRLRLVTAAADPVLAALHTVRPRAVVLNHYPGGLHRDAELHGVYDVARDVLHHVERALVADPVRRTTLCERGEPGMWWLTSIDRTRGRVR